jgi:hypothetical protein
MFPVNAAQMRPTRGWDVARGSALLVGCAAASVGLLTDFFSESEYEVAVAEESREAFLLSCTNTYKVIVVDFTSNNASENALTVESITLVNPAARIAALAPEEHHKLSGDTTLAMSKAHLQLKGPLQRRHLPQLLAD